MNVRTTLNLGPSATERQFRLGMKYLEAKNYREGRCRLEEAIRIHPDCAEVCCYLGSLCYPPGRYYIEWINQEQDAWKEAFAIVEVERLHPLSAEYRNAVYESETALRRRNALLQDLHLSHCRASAYFDAATTRHPPYTDAYFYRGLAKFNDEYIEQDDRGEERARWHWHRRSYTYKSESTLEAASALEDFSKAIDIKPGHSQARKYRGLVFLKLNHYQAAIADFNVALETNSFDAEAYRHRSKAHEHVGRYVDAIADFDAAQRIAPPLTLFPDLDGRRARLVCLAAIDYCDAAISCRPNSSEFYVLRGRNRLNLERCTLGLSCAGAIELYSEAIKDFDSAIQLDPDNGEAFTYRGRAKLKLRRCYSIVNDVYKAIQLLDEAVCDFDDALRLNPCDTEAYRFRRAATFNTWIGF